MRQRGAASPGPLRPVWPGAGRWLGGRRAADVAGEGRSPGTAGRLCCRKADVSLAGSYCWRCAVSRYRIVMALACMAAAGCAAPPAVTHTAQARAGGAVWGRAIEVPGLGRLNAGGEAQVSVVSCASAGNCAAGGFYRDRSRHSQAWVASQRNGRWGTAIEVPGTAALNAGGVSSVSCASAGTCTAGGSYTDGSGLGNSQGFVASQVNGRWGTAIEVPGTAALNAGGDTHVSSVACASAGNCAAVGFYHDGSSIYSEAFVASQRNGRWGTAIEVPGTAALNPAGDTQVSSVACAPAGSCTAGGSYDGRHGSY